MGIYFTGGWVGPGSRLDRCGEPETFSSTKIRTPNRPSRSESLYRRRCSGPYVVTSQLSFLITLRVRENGVGLRMALVLDAIYSECT